MIKGEDAAKTVTSSDHESYDVIGFDETEASRLGVSVRDSVQVAPDDTGKKLDIVCIYTIS